MECPPRTRGAAQAPSLAPTAKRGETGPTKAQQAFQRGLAALAQGVEREGAHRPVPRGQALSRWWMVWEDLRVDHGGGGSSVGSASPSYKGHRYPVEIISHCVWLYFRFPLSFREVEELMLERGVIVSHETIRRWCAKFGQAYANGLRRRRPQPGDK
jgi:hypothetical protein